MMFRIWSWGQIGDIRGVVDSRGLNYEAGIILCLDGQGEEGAVLLYAQMPFSVVVSSDYRETWKIYEQLRFC